MGSKPSKVTEVNAVNAEKSPPPDVVVSNTGASNGKADVVKETAGPGDAADDEGGGDDDEPEPDNSVLDEDVRRQIEDSKEIFTKHADIIKSELSAEASEEGALDTDKIVKSSKVIGGLYFKLKKKKLAKRRVYRISLAQYMVETGGMVVIVDAIRKATSHWWRDQNDPEYKGSVGYYNIFYFATQILWNFSDSVDVFAKCIVDEGIMGVVEEAIDKEYQYAMAQSIDLKSKKVVKACLAITANCAFHELSRSAVKESKILDLLAKLQNTGFGELDIYFVLVPAYIVNEEQSKELFHDEVILGKIVDHVRKATNDKTRRSRGFSVHELCVLIGRLAVNDANKATLTKVGTEPLLIDVAQRGSVLERIAALEALRHLSFSDSKSILRDSIDVFQELLKNDNKKIRKAAEGILWNVENAKTRDSSASHDNKEPHVMISYQWDCQPRMIKFKDILQNFGYKVWMDIESMEGSTLEGMAMAVENAVVVFMCMSEKYKESANCRMEAEYAFQMKKEIIPLMMDDNYKPDGWLGFLMGAKLYYKLVQDSDFSDIGEKLSRVIGEKGKKSALPAAEAVNVELTDKFDDILGDMEKLVKTEILLKQQSYQETVQKLKAAVAKGDYNSMETTRPALFTIASMYSQLKNHSLEIRAKYKNVLLRTFVDEGGLDALVACVHYSVDHGWRTENGAVDEAYWKPFNTAISTLWNFTDLSGDLCKMLLQKEILMSFRKVLESEGQIYVNDEANAIAGRAVRSCLACIYNSCMHDESRGIVREANVVDEFLSPLLALKSEQPRTYMIFIMAYTLNEEQSERFFADEGLIGYIVGRQTKAANHENHKDGGYTALELTRGVKRLAANDSNKLQIVKAGGLVPLESLMKDGDISEKTAAAETVWELAFHADNKPVILENALVEELEKYKTHEDPHLKKACLGALWVLRGKQEKFAKEFAKQLKFGTQKGTGDSETGPGDEAGGERQQHIMISYQWNTQPLMIEIKDRLKAEGYKVWMDIELMGGSTLAAMADAVENAAAIIVCMTQEYKDSANCRTEDEYAFQLQKTIVPVKPLRNYRPDGWLGMILGAKLYFKFSGQDDFETSFSALVKELGERGKAGGMTSQVAPKRKVHSARGKRKEASVTWASSSTTNQATGALKWSKEEVEKWLKDNDLDMMKLKTLTGEQLMYLRDLRREAPEFFYHYVETYFKLVDLTQLMKFTTSLDKL